MDMCLTRKTKSYKIKTETISQKSIFMQKNTKDRAYLKKSTVQYYLSSEPLQTSAVETVRYLHGVVCMNGAALQVLLQHGRALCVQHDPRDETLQRRKRPHGCCSTGTAEWRGDVWSLVQGGVDTLRAVQPSFAGKKELKQGE